MAKVGRKPNPIEGVRVVVYIPADIVAKMELDLMNPVKGVAQYGARSKLVEQLLREYYAKKELSRGGGG